jgi:tRNA(adenine34) deaminase
MIHEDWMHMALKIASEDDNEVPVGAIVVFNGRMIASAHNERERSLSPFTHAEMLAMERASAILGSRVLIGCTLYVTLEPCPMCAGALLMAQPDLCIFGAYDDARGCCGSVYNLPQDAVLSRVVPCRGGVLERESKELLSRFFIRLRST